MGLIEAVEGRMSQTAGILQGYALRLDRYDGVRAEDAGSSQRGQSTGRSVESQETELLDRVVVAVEDVKRLNRAIQLAAENEAEIDETQQELHVEQNQQVLQDALNKQRAEVQSLEGLRHQLLTQMGRITDAMRGGGSSIWSQRPEDSVDPAASPIDAAAPDLGIESDEEAADALLDLRPGRQQASGRGPVF